MRWFFRCRFLDGWLAPPRPPVRGRRRVSVRRHPYGVGEIPLDPRDAIGRVDVQHHDPHAAAAEGFESRAMPFRERLRVELVVEEEHEAGRLASRSIAIDRDPTHGKVPDGLIEQGERALLALASTENHRNHHKITF